MSRKKTENTFSIIAIVLGGLAFLFFPPFLGGAGVIVAVIGKTKKRKNVVYWTYSKYCWGCCRYDTWSIYGTNVEQNLILIFCFIIILLLLDKKCFY